MIPIIIKIGNAYVSRQLQDASTTEHGPSAYPATPLCMDFRGREEEKKKEEKEEVEKEKEQEGLERVQEE